MPVGGQHRVHDAVEPATLAQFRLAQGPLPAKAEASATGPAGQTPLGNPNLDSVQMPPAQRVVDERPHRRGHDSAALVLLAEPVAEAGRAVSPIDADAADNSRNRAPADDGSLKAVVLRE